MGISYKVFDGNEDVDEVLGFLRGRVLLKAEDYPADLISRINSKYLSNTKTSSWPAFCGETIKAAERLLKAKFWMLSQLRRIKTPEHFFNSTKMDSRLDGARAIPLRTRGFLLHCTCCPKVIYPSEVLQRYQ